MAKMKSQLVRGPACSKTNLTEFQKEIEKKYGEKFESYCDLHRWSLQHPTEFWTEIWQFLKIVHSEPFTEVMEAGKKFEDIPKWFLGAKLNYAENMLRHPPQNVALILTGEEWTTDEIVTFGQLRDEVATLTSALRKSGIKQGDVIMCYISNRKETIVALLAAASIGALFSTASPLLGVKGLLRRFEQLSPKVLLTMDRYLHNKEENDIHKRLPEIVRGLPSLEYVIIVPSNNASRKKNISDVPKSVFYADFLQKGLDVDGQIPKPSYDQLSFNHPFIIIFTSGTTGPPKAVVHSTGAVLIGPLQCTVMNMNVKPTDVIYTMHYMGWASWIMGLVGLAAGASLVIFEGYPFRSYGTRFWDVCDQHKVSFIFLTPSVIEGMMKDNLLPGPHNKLASLHTLISGAAFVRGELFDVVHRSIKRDVFFSILYGSTEMMTNVTIINHSFPVYKEESQVPLLGFDVRCYNNAGENVLDEKGEIIIAKPFPSMPLFFWNDPNMEKYRSTFFNKFPGVWCQGDYGAINSQTRGLIIYGRNDEAIKQRGLRFGSSEIYSVVNKMDKVDDSLCTGWLDKDRCDIAVLFVKMKLGIPLTAEVLLEVREAIKTELTDVFVPEIILQAEDIPYNMNGKRMEILVRKILAKSDVSSDAVANPECLTEYITAAKRLGEM